MKRALLLVVLLAACSSGSKDAATTTTVSAELAACHGLDAAAVELGRPATPDYAKLAATVQQLATQASGTKLEPLLLDLEPKARAQATSDTDVPGLSDAMKAAADRCVAIGDRG